MLARMQAHVDAAPPLNAGQAATIREALTPRPKLNAARQAA